MNLSNLHEQPCNIQFEETWAKNVTPNKENPNANMDDIFMKNCVPILNALTYNYK